MKTIVALLLIFPVFSHAQPFQLAPPRTGIGLFQSPFFTDSIAVVLRFDLPGSLLRYTLDGTLPDTGSPVFKDKLVIHTTCMLTAVAEHPDFLSSESLRVQLVRMNPEFEPQEAVLAVEPGEKYRGWGAATLHDYDKGHEQFDNGRWLGFEGGDLDYTMVFSKKIAPKSLMVSVLSAPASWILPPRKIELWASAGKKGAWRKVATLDIPPLQQGENDLAEKIFFLNFKPVKARHWRVVATNGGPLPVWHPGNSKPAWLFVDEVALH